MSNQTGMTRRHLIAGIAVGLPSSAIARQLAAQTPTTLIAVTPEQLLETLEQTPIDARYEGVRLKPVRWDTFEEAGYDDAVGGVQVVVERNPETVFGGYVVFKDEKAAGDAVTTVKEQHAAAMIESFPKTIEDHDGVFIEYEDEGTRSITLIPVRNVLVIGYDTDIRGRGRRRRYRGRDRRSIGHAAVLVRHLLPILNRQT